MRNRCIASAKIWPICIWLCCLTMPILAQEASDFDRKARVVLREIGDALLHESGDSTSRVLPVTTDEAHNFILSFESALSIDPGSLAVLVDSFITRHQLSEHYMLETIECDSGAVVHSFEMQHNRTPDQLACQGRKLPKGCYQLAFYFLDRVDSGTDNSMANEASQLKIAQTSFLVIFLAIVIFASAFMLIRMRSGSLSDDKQIIPIGMFRFDRKNLTISSGKQKLELSNKEADLLSLLYDSANKAVERSVILEKVWEDDGDYVGRTLDVYVSRLRKKLEADQSIRIMNIRGVGYKLVI